jgi:ESS family glutamate:Na+ symporter
MTFDASDTIVIAILAYFTGRWLTRRIEPLDTYRIPVAVTGGLIVAVLVTLLHGLAGFEVRFTSTDLPLLAFFATVGLTARIADLRRGGRPLLIALVVAVLALVLQNMIGVLLAKLLGFHPLLGLMAGSVALIGGHGTAAAWGPVFADAAPLALAVGLATATFGLVAGGILGGPLGRYLVQRHSLVSRAEPDYAYGVPRAEERVAEIDVDAVFASVLTIALAIGLGEQLNSVTTWLGINLPQFVTALFAGIIVGNLGPVVAPTLRWPMHDPAMALVSELALGLFLVRALMGLQLWSLWAVAGPLLVILACQTLLVLALAVFVLFPLLSRSFDAAVIAGGFVGLALGATPTAVANMSALTLRFGPSPLSFVVVPLVGAFFVDLVNAVVLTTSFHLFGP